MPIPDGSYSLTLTIVDEGCEGGRNVGKVSDGQLDIVTDSQGQTWVTFATTYLAIPDLVGFPAPGVQGTLIAISHHEFKLGWPKAELRMTNDGDKHYSVHVSWQELRKTDKGLQMCENEYRGKAALKSETKSGR